MRNLGFWFLDSKENGLPIETKICAKEKAPAEMRGAYPIICQEFTKNCLLGKYEYVNREEDIGIEGLRKAKQSYYPEIFLKKGVAVYNDWGI